MKIKKGHKGMSCQFCLSQLNALHLNENTSKQFPIKEKNISKQQGKNQNIANEILC